MVQIGISLIAISYYSWASRQSFFCLRLHADEVNIGQSNEKWPISLVHMSKPLLTVITAIGQNDGLFDWPYKPCAHARLQGLLKSTLRAFSKWKLLSYLTWSKRSHFCSLRMWLLQRMSRLLRISRSSTPCSRTSKDWKIEDSVG